MDQSSRTDRASSGNAGGLAEGGLAEGGLAEGGLAEGGQHAHKIEIKDRTVNELEEILSPDDRLILRCVDCQEFFLPREIHILKRRYKDLFGLWTWEVSGLCPACHPHPREYRNDDKVPASTFIELTRSRFEETRRSEKAGLVSVH